MPYRMRPCPSCGKQFRPKIPAHVSCTDCRRLTDDAIRAYPPRRLCEICTGEFQPIAPGQSRCPSCRKLAQTEARPDLLAEETHKLAPPLKQAVFDLETFGLDRGWGVLLMGVILVHGEGEPQWYEFDITQSESWPDRRSDDKELAENIIEVLRGCHICYAHNGRNFDLPWLNSLALKYGLDPLVIKLVDPVQVARRKYRIGSNTLAALANFLELSEHKMPLPPDIWRQALLDNDRAAWDLLRERCRSDVRLLNSVASRVTRDVGMIDYNGSAWR